MESFMAQREQVIFFHNLKNSSPTRVDEDLGQYEWWVDEEKPEKRSFPLIRPQQFCSPQVGFSERSPEMKLMYAVLEDAVDRCRKRWTTKKNDQRLAREAEAWVFSDSLDWPFSFLNICAALGIDPDYLRRGLRRWHRQPPARCLGKRRPRVAVSRPLKIAA
jgi:hypothetical protein